MMEPESQPDPIDPLPPRDLREVSDLTKEHLKASSPLQLLVVMPVFNEQDSIRKVVVEWFNALEAATPDFAILAINDGSKDATLQTLGTLQSELGDRLEIISRENRGHGQSCIQGYRVALERRIP